MSTTMMDSLRHPNSSGRVCSLLFRLLLLQLLQLAQPTPWAQQLCLLLQQRQEASWAWLQQRVVSQTAASQVQGLPVHLLLLLLGGPGLLEGLVVQHAAAAVVL